jgi:hypothetical protein
MLAARAIRSGAELQASATDTASAAFQVFLGCPESLDTGKHTGDDS